VLAEGTPPRKGKTQQNPWCSMWSTPHRPRQSKKGGYKRTALHWDTVVSRPPLGGRRQVYLFLSSLCDPNT